MTRETPGCPARVASVASSRDAGRPAARAGHDSRVKSRKVATMPIARRTPAAARPWRRPAAPEPWRRRVDVVLTCDHDEDIAFLVSHAKRALRVIQQNVVLALATKLAFLISAVLGAAPLWLAVVADTGATVAVTLNGLRLLRAQTPE